jgi:RNA polymerase sigma factor (sigma-70 family)
MEDRASHPSADDLLAHAAFVRGLALALVGDAHEADEIAQETYLRALERPPGVVVNARAWLAGVARNVLRMRRREEGRRHRREAVVARPDAEPSTADSVARMEVLRRLTTAVEGLDEPYRGTLLLRYFDRLMPAEIARRQGVPVKTVKTRLHRALGQLRARLDGQHRDRRSWALLLVPLADRSPLGLAPVASGAILMTLKTKLAVTAAAVVLLAGTILTLSGALSPEPPEIDVVGERAAPPIADATEGNAADASSDEDETADPIASPTDTASVRGTVVDAASGAPLEGAEVVLARPDPAGGRPRAVARVETDADGRFALPLESTGTVLVAARRAGYAPKVLPPTAVPAEGREDVRLELVRFPCVVRATVIDATTREPVPGVVVHQKSLVEEGMPLEGDAPELWVEDVIRDLRNTVRAVADEGGRATLRSGPGPFALVVRHPRYRDWIGERFALERDVPRDAVVALRPYPPSEREIRFGGVVTDGRTTRPLADVAVTCRYREGVKLREATATTDADGKYALAVPTNAEIVIELAKEGYETGRMNLNPVHDTWRKGDIALLPSGGGPRRGEARIEGRVVDAETGAPLSGVPLVVHRGLDESGRGGIGSWGGFQSGDDGTYRIDLRPIADGEERVRVVVEVGGRQPFASDLLTIAPDRVTTLPVPLAGAAATAGITGTVTDAGTGKPVAGAVVDSFDRFRNALGRTVTDAEGRFELPVRGREYVLVVRAEGYAAGSSSLEGDPAAASDRTIALVRADARIAGTVRDAATGAPLAGVRLSLFVAPEWCGPGPTAVTNERGEYAYDVAPGRYLVRALKEGYGPACGRPVDVAAAARASAEIELSPADCVLTGTVRLAGTGEAAPRGAERVSILRLARDEREELECRMSAFGGRPKVESEGDRFTVRLPPGKWLLMEETPGHFRIRREIVVKAGERRELALEIEPIPAATATVRGTVRFRRSGAPAPKARAVFRLRGHRVGRAVADEQGRFEGACPPGEITVRVTYLVGREPVTRERTVEVRDGGVTDVELVVDE